MGPNRTSILDPSGISTLADGVRGASHVALNFPYRKDDTKESIGMAFYRNWLYKNNFFKKLSVIDVG